MATALITGITGQDGSYLAELLLARGHAVHGLVRRASSDNTLRIGHLAVPLHAGDLADPSSLEAVVRRVRPDAIYNLAAQSHVSASFEMPLYTADIVYLGALRLLEIVRRADWPIRFYQASSSEMFGTGTGPFSESSPFHPRSPYAVAKVAAFHQTVNHREAYGLFACNGILFNHESPRRGENFVTRKITRGVAQIVAGRATRVRLGNLDARRDWGASQDYVDAMARIVDHHVPDDFVVATGETRSVREFAAAACALVDLDVASVIEVDPKLLRPADVPEMCGDPTKARTVLGWAPRTSFRELVASMVAADLRAEGVDPARFGLG
jgi:GDPmannose 4,6-dehydratase